VRGIERAGSDERRSSWTFLTNHAHVLLCIVHDPMVRLRDVADTVGITERAAQNIVADLVHDGYLLRTRVGRRNRYEVNTDLPLHRDDHAWVSIGGLLGLLASAPRTMAFATGVAGHGRGDAALN
jgi:hypothetical protein